MEILIQNFNILHMVGLKQFTATAGGVNDNFYVWCFSIFQDLEDNWCFGISRMCDKIELIILCSLRLNSSKEENSWGFDYDFKKEIIF